MAQGWREIINPANADQNYLLQDNGVVLSSAAAIPITTTMIPPDNTVPSAGQPGKIRALQITDWAGPGGYWMNWFGTITAFGTATAPSAQAGGTPFPFSTAIDMFMSPVGDGSGYLLDLGGAVYNLGGAGSVPQGPAFNINTGHYAIRLAFETFGGKFYILTSWGAIIELNGATGLTLVDGAANNVNGTALGYRGPFFPNGAPAVARGFAMYDYTLGRGWMLDAWGGVHALNGAQAATGNPSSPGFDSYRDLQIIDAGLGLNPLTLVDITALDARNVWQVPGTPTVTVTTPVDPTTNTTRPRISWSYSNTFGDGQASYIVRVFSSAQYGIGGFDPNVSPFTFQVSATSATTFFVDPPIALANGTWRAYVQATSTAGNASAWAFKQWVENVTPPATPTVTPTVVGTALQGISLLVHSASSPAGVFYGVQYQDVATDPWRWVRGGDALVPDVSHNATVIDYEATIAVTRTYRAVAYTTPLPGQIIESPFSATATATITDRTSWLLTNPNDHTQGGAIHLVADTFKEARPIVASAFQPSGRKKTIVMTDGAPKGMVADLQLVAPLLADYTLIKTLMETGLPLLLRDPYGRSWYIQPGYDTGGHLRGAIGGVAAWTSQLALAPADCGETPVGNNTGFLNHVSFPIIEVDRPLAGPSSGPLALLT